MITLATILSVIVSYTVINFMTKKLDKKEAISTDKVVFLNSARHA